MRPSDSHHVQTVGLDSIVQPGDWTYTKVLDGEAVVLDERTDRLHHFSPAATVLWCELDGTRSLATIARSLSGAAGRSADDLERDLVRLAGQLAMVGLISIPSPLHGEGGQRCTWF